MAIIMHLRGGLGNQLFQYAMVRALSIAREQTFYLDSSWFTQTYEGVTPRQLSLVHLQIVGQPQPFPNLPKRASRGRHFLQKILPLHPYVYQQDNAYHFDPNLTNLRLWPNQDLYLLGYWQSFRYFEQIRPHLLQELRSKALMQAHYTPYLQAIDQHVSSCMVHIRRGDYVHLPTAAKIHGALSLNYYQTAMGQMLARDGKTQFFIFSDDLAWAKANLPFSELSIYIESLSDDRAVIDELTLMRHCRHHIIANSSLSWWGAWLSEYPDQQVICPARWIHDPKQSFEDLLPPQWRVLAVS